MCGAKVARHVSASVYVGLRNHLRQCGGGPRVVGGGRGGNVPPPRRAALHASPLPLPLAPDIDGDVAPLRSGLGHHVVHPPRWNEQAVASLERGLQAASRAVVGTSARCEAPGAGGAMPGAEVEVRQGAAGTSRSGTSAQRGKRARSTRRGFTCFMKEP